MSGDPHMPRFMSYLSLFTFLKVVLVSSECAICDVMVYINVTFNRLTAVYANWHQGTAHAKALIKPIGIMEY